MTNGHHVHGAIYAIWDTLANEPVLPFQERNDAVAMRRFADIMTNPQTPISKHLNEHNLVRLGTFRPDMTMEAKTEVLMTGAQLTALITKES